MSIASIMAAPTIGCAFSLVDHNGRDVNDVSYRGKHVLMFFGFTHCKVVCPRTLGKLSEALNRLGSAADRVQALYITVDPARDTPEVMRAFLQREYPRFTGLTGSPERIEAARTAFRVFVRRRDEADGNYQMPHSAFTYLLDPKGAFVEHWPPTMDMQEIAQRLAELLAVKPSKSKSNPNIPAPPAA